MKKTNETGRSLVELIGVLCVMGVLSVGSLMTYDYTRSRARYTGIIESASKILAVARTKGRLVTTYSEKMDLTAEKRDKAIMTAEIVGEVGYVTICVCEQDKDKQQDIRTRVTELAGFPDVDDADYGDTAFHEKQKCSGTGSKCFCANKKEPYCFTLEFDFNETPPAS